jgi:hypothetical protein
MKVGQDFERWAKGFSGCDGGNLHGAIWFCGIEWGTGTEHDLREEIFGAQLRSKRGDKKLRMPELIHNTGRWSMPNDMRD